MRLGYHYHIPVTERGGELWTPGYQARFLDELARHCEELVCFLHSARPEEAGLMDTALRAPNLRWVQLGPHDPVPRRILCWRLIRRAVESWRCRLDALLVRAPTPMLPAVVRGAGGLPLALLLVGDYLAGVEALPQPRWRKELIRIWARWNHAEQFRAARRAVTFVNSRKLYEELAGRIPRLYETRTTTLTAADFYEREDTCAGRPVRLLYTGRIAAEKGLRHLAEALVRLVRDGEDVVLELAGPMEAGEKILEEVREITARSGAAGRWRYLGCKPVGEELFRLYRQSDVYVLASELEGFPRTIWEAMANSLPVVATAVGSIPFYLKNGESALLVPPRDSAALAAAIGRVIHDGELRRRMIRRGLELARQVTLEAVVKDIVSALRSATENR